MRSQRNYETNVRAPDVAYLAAIAAAGADVNYIVTGGRSVYPTQSQSQHTVLIAADAASAAYNLKPDEEALLDNYRHATPEGKKALKVASHALAQSCEEMKKGAA